MIMRKLRDVMDESVDVYPGVILRVGNDVFRVEITDSWLFGDKQAFACRDTEEPLAWLFFEDDRGIWKDDRQAEFIDLLPES
jgi:hypothetical protein